MKLIVNPRAGKFRKGSLLNKFIRLVERNFHREFNIEFTKAPLHAAEIAYRAIKEGFQNIVSVGGDGTFNEVVQGTRGENVNLGIIPMGSGNDFAKSINLYLPPFKVLGSIHRYKPLLVDHVKVNDTYFVNVLGTGIDSEVVKYLKNKRNYLFGFYRSLIKHKPNKFDVTIDGREYRFNNVNLLAVANGKYFGHSMKIAPNADVTDGLLNIVVVRNFRRLKLFFLFPRIYSGTHVNHPNVITLKGKSIKVSSEKEIYYQRDGELGKSPELNIEVVHKGLKLLVPTES